MQQVNFNTTNPAQQNDRVTELQTAVQLDEANNFAAALYTAAGAIALGGKVALKAGSGAAMTLALPAAGAQNAGGQDGMTMKFVSLDAEAYTITTPADGINGADDTATFGGAIGDAMELMAWGGTWVTMSLKGVTLSEV